MRPCVGCGCSRTPTRGSAASSKPSLCHVPYACLRAEQQYGLVRFEANPFLNVARLVDCAERARTQAPNDGAPTVTPGDAEACGRRQQARPPGLRATFQDAASRQDPEALGGTMPDPGRMNNAAASDCPTLAERRGEGPHPTTPVACKPAVQRRPPSGDNATERIPLEYPSIGTISIFVRS